MLFGPFSSWWGVKAPAFSSVSVSSNAIRKELYLVAAERTKEEKVKDKTSIAHCRNKVFRVVKILLRRNWKIEFMKLHLCLSFHQIQGLI